MDDGSKSDVFDTPSKEASPFFYRGDITVDPKGFAELLDAINVHKASGQDGMNAVP